MHDTIIDQQELMERIGGDMELLEELLELFEEDYPELLASIQHAIEIQDGESLKRSAHTLKGAVGNFAALKAHALAFELEKKGEAGDFSDASTLLTQLESAIHEFKNALKALAPSV